jgi:parallel beta-helix repeat protein
MENLDRRMLLAGLGLVGVAAASTAGAGTLNPPPGPVAPTGKTTNEIEPRIAINATNTPGDSANLYIISASGSYYLTGNITGVSGLRGILLNANNVTIDLNGFEMIGVAGSGNAISDGGVNQGNATIHNGTIRGWGFSGIYLATSFDSRIHDLIVTNNGQNGITGGDACHIRDCVFRDNGFSNVLTGFNANISNCTAVGSATGAGFDLGQDSTISNSVANFNNLFGIHTSDNCQVSHCAANANLDGGILTGAGATVAHCSASLNGGSTAAAISVLGGSTVSNCSATSNSLQYGISAIFASTVVHCTASYNQSDQATSAGIFAPGCTVKDCTCNNNATTNASPTGLTGMGIFSNNTATLIQNCDASYNSGDGISLSDRTRVRDNLCTDNGAAGIHATGGGNLLEGNQLTNNHAAGMLVSATVNLVMRNAARANTPNYSIVAGNRVATIITPGTSSTISGDIGGTSFSSDVTVNLVY